MKNRKLTALLMSLSLMMVCALSGCGKEESASGSADSKKTKIDFFIWGNGPAELKGDKEIIAEFEKQNPSIKVNVVNAPYDKYGDKFLTMASSGKQPDVSWIPEELLPGFVAKGLFKPLNDEMEKAGMKKEEWLPGSLDLATVDGKIYGLPRDVITMNIAYNKDMFDKAGVPYPSTTWTWDDFLAAAKKLTKTENDKITQFGIASYQLESALYQNGAAFFSNDGKQVLVDSPEAIEAIQWVADLANVHHVAPTAAQTQGTGDLFLAGKAAMTFSGPWNWKQYKEGTNFKFDVAKVPAGKAGNKVKLLGLSVGISSKTKHPKESWKLLEFLTHGKGQEIQADIVGAHPSVERTTGQFVKTKYAPEHAQLVNDMLEQDTVVIHSFEKYSEAMNMVQPVIDQIMLGKVKAKDALPKIADKVRKELNIN